MNIHHCLFELYRTLDDKFNSHEDQSFQKLVNFKRIEIQPVHRWFYYQEGYSTDLVSSLIKRLNPKGNSLIILDPFAGSGTTLLVAKHLGIESVGFEINPVAAFVSKVKTRNYTRDDIDQVMQFKLPRYKYIPRIHLKYQLKMIQNLYEEENLIKIELLKNDINKIQNIRVKNLLFLCMLSILENVSNYRKGGNGLKHKKVNSELDTYIEFERKLLKIVEDLKSVGIGPEPHIIEDTCLNIDNYGINDIDMSIFSPPYVNCFDPFEVYKIELWLGDFISSYDQLHTKRKLSLCSNLNSDLKKDINDYHHNRLLSTIIDYLLTQKLWDNRLIKMLDVYFYDINILIEKLKKKIRKNGHCAIVIGNSAYANIVVATDLIIAQLAEQNSFRVEEIIIARRNETSSQQHKNLGQLKEYIRESIILLKNV